MKIECGLTLKEQRIANRKWHKWFAWYPVRVGHREKRWLEYVYRRDNYLASPYCIDYEYAALDAGIPKPITPIRPPPPPRPPTPRSPKGE